MMITILFLLYDKFVLLYLLNKIIFIIIIECIFIFKTDFQHQLQHIDQLSSIIYF